MENPSSERALGKCNRHFRRIEGAGRHKSDDTAENFSPQTSNRAMRRCQPVKHYASKYRVRETQSLRLQS
jgi:hypothetical protein